MCHLLRSHYFVLAGKCQGIIVQNIHIIYRYVTCSDLTKKSLLGMGENPGGSALPINCSARPITFLFGGPRPVSPIIFKRMRGDPAKPITFLNVYESTRPGTARSIRLYKVSARPGTARNTDCFVGPAHNMPTL